MLTLFTAITIVAPLPVMRPDTPPPLPVPIERLLQSKSREDIKAATRLADGAPAPATLVLPQLTNRRDVLAHMRNNFPPDLRTRTSIEMPWAWVRIDEQGLISDARLVKSSGYPGLDSLALIALRKARFNPALIDSKAVSVWTPIPIQVSYDVLGQNRPVPPDPDRPSFTPYTIKPELANRFEVMNALMKEYPPELRAAGVGGTTLIWLFITENGETTKPQIKQTSGHEQLDRAAIAVARTMRWTPAKNRDEVVPVWIQVPIVFKAGK